MILKTGLLLPANDFPSLVKIMLHVYCVDYTLHTIVLAVSASMEHDCVSSLFLSMLGGGGGGGGGGMSSGWTRGNSTPKLVLYSGYFKGGTIFVDGRICSDSW